MMATPFFSVIIPSFDRRPFLEKAVNSVLSQSFGDLELVVVDDGSSDGSVEMLSGYTDKRLICLRQENRGVSVARNRGLKKSRGRFIAFLDSDDFWTPEKLERSAEYIKAHPSVRVFHTEEIWYRRGKLLEQKEKHRKPTGWVYRQALPLCCISISTAVIKRDVFASIGDFDENLEACEDYDFWLRTTSRFEVKLIPEYLTIKDGGRPDQLSSRVWGLDRFRIRALQKILTSGTLEKEDRRATISELTRKCRLFAAGAEKRGKHDIAECYRNIPGNYS